MKRASVALAVLVAFASLLLPSRAAASEAWILNIGVRGIPNQESGMVRINLELSAAPAGSQLVVGSTTLNLGDTLTVAGDSVTYEALTGNNARITYVPKSNFGADFCAGLGAVEKNINMRFVGAQDVTAYRMSTYVVAAPNAECSQATKHTGDTPASLIPNDDGVAPALDAIYKGRNTFDVALVLDKSGSMNDLPPGAQAGPKKIDILKTAVQNFIGQWELLDAPPGGGAEYSGDRIGLVFFDSSAQPQTLVGADPPANFFLQRGGASAWDAIITKVNSLVPGSSTSLGGGINEGMSQWKADPKNDLDVVLITDGMQNTAPLIAPTGTGFLGLAPVAGLPQELRKRFVPIQTIAFGTPAQVDDTLMRNISLETSGISYQAISVNTMFDIFGKTLVAILKGNTASMATGVIDTLTGTGPSAAVPFNVDRSPQRVLVSVQWPPPARQMLDLDVYPPGAIVPAIPTSAKKTPQASIKAFDMARGFSMGAWSVRVKRDLKSADAVPYTLNVMFLEKHLDYQFSLDNLHAVTGDNLGIKVLIDWNGKPLTGLPAGAIRLRVLQQPDGMGNILHASKVKVPGGNTVTPTGDIQTPYDYKIAALGQPLIDSTTPKDVAVIPMAEQGKGIYSASFPGTSIPGTYAFEAILDWNIPATGHVSRQERLEEDVKPRADSHATAITLTGDAFGVWTLTVTPRDRFGNYFGPGYASLVQAAVRSGGKLRSATPADQNQLGTYTFTIAGSPGVTPVVDVTVDGVLLGR
ncbi:MAG TPA: vWA domain-containing protein [Thermoanaerobaculia bacterium]|nr:vWA domain-containing protein [Thermoanaerobaculia bacterium]